MHYTSIYCNNLFIPEIPFHWYMIHYVAVDPRNDVVVVVALKQFVEQFIKKFFCSVFVFQKRPSIKCAAQSFSIFPLGKFYPIPIFVWVLNALRVCVTILKGAMILSNKFSIISLCDYSNWCPKIRNFNVFFNQWIGKFLEVILFWTNFAIFGEKNHQMSNNTKLK